MPGASYRFVVTQSFTVAGELADFDAVTVRAELIAAYPAAMDVALTATAGSVQVEARLILASQADAETVASALQGETAASLGAMLGVSVTSMEAATVEAALLPAPSPPAPADPPAADAVMPPLPVNTAHLAHGSLMTLAWGLLLPAGSLVPRCWKAALPDGKWYRLHRNVQVLGVLLSVAGLVVSIAMNHPMAGHFNSLHKALGLAVSIAALVQPLLAVFRPAKPPPPPPGAKAEPPSRMRVAWRLKHAVLGYSLIILAIVQLVTGVRSSYNLEFLYGVYGAGLGLVLLLSGVGLVVGKRGGEAGGGGGGKGGGVFVSRA